MELDIQEEKFEKERLEKTLKFINENIEKMSKLKKDGRSEIIAQRREFMENTSVAIRNIDDVIELNTYNQFVAEKERQYGEVSRKLYILEKLANSPYFARIDFKENGEYEYEKIYIGIASIYDEETYESYIYDWRAPISSMFYEYDCGRAEYMSPMGKIEGDLSLKRQYKIENGNFEYMFDSDIKIDDEILQRVLSANTDTKLKVIVSSIQKQQNAAIRYTQKPNLIVLGPAGSGKTSVGLHRMAYLLYNFRQSIKSENVLVISNNNIYNSYISSIIPELGEEDINRTTFMELIKRFIPENFKIFDYYEQSEYYMNAVGEDIRIEAMKIKYSYDFLEYIKKYFASYKGKFCDIKYKEEIICSKEELEKRFNFSNNPNNFAFSLLINRVYSYIDDKVSDFFEENKEAIKADIIEKNQGIADDDYMNGIYNSTFESTKANNKNKFKSVCSLDAVKLYKEILSAFIKENKLDRNIYKFTFDRISQNELLFEDILVLICIKLFLGEINLNDNIKHVLLDEAQDFNILQHFIIKSVMNKSKFTILADINQGIFPYINISDKSEFVYIYGEEKTDILQLGKSYRSTREINNLAVKLLDKNDIEYFDRQGQEPEIFITENKVEKIRQIIKENDLSNANSVCIITKTVPQAQQIYSQLKEEFKISLISQADDVLFSGLVIMPVIFSKGLEFDNVIISDASDIQFSDYKDKRVLYLMCTRALHRLYIVAEKKLTKFLES